MSRWNSCTDAELLAAGPANPDAFAAFYRRHVPTVLALVGRRARRQADVGDLVAEVFATALVHRRRYDPKRGTAVAWLTGIALNKLADANRRGEVEARMCRRIGVRRPAVDAAGFELDQGGEWLEDLPADQRRAVEARVLEDKTYEQIADEQAVSPQAVRKRVSRALSTLRSRFQEEE